MKIDHIYIRNFRGFEEAKFEFKSNFTVVIGNNGVGKSSVLNAVQVGLGALLQSMPTLPANQMYRRQFKLSERFRRYDAARKDFLPSKDLTKILVTSTLPAESEEETQSKTITWERAYLMSNSTTHNRTHSSDIVKHAHFLFENHGKLQHVLYPVLANFYINRTNAQVRRLDKSWKQLSRLEKGYYAALGESVDFTGVYEWLYQYDKKIADGQEFEGTRGAMMDAIKTAIPYIKEVDYNTKYDEFEVLVDFQDGQPIERKLSSMLSDGMKSVLNMVAAIAYRCIILNGKLGSRAVVASPGVVLIDELDMHLHPRWQRHIVKDFKAAFPNLQFIVTTHSPFIVQSLESMDLINLDRVTDVRLKDLSIGEVSESVMGIANEMSEVNAHDERISQSYFETILNPTTKTQQEVSSELDRLEMKISDPGVRALLKMKRLQKDI